MLDGFSFLEKVRSDATCSIICHVVCLCICIAGIQERIKDGRGIKLLYLFVFHVKPTFAFYRMNKCTEKRHESLSL